MVVGISSGGELPLCMSLCDSPLCGGIQAGLYLHECLLIFPLPAASRQVNQQTLMLDSLNVSLSQEAWGQRQDGRICAAVAAFWTMHCPAARVFRAAAASARVHVFTSVDSNTVFLLATKYPVTSTNWVLLFFLLFGRGDWNSYKINNLTKVMCEHVAGLGLNLTDVRY